MIKVGVLGATGYAGIETVRLLAGHKEAEIVRIVSHSYEGTKISDLYPNLKGICDIECTGLDVDDIAENCDVVFTALPHGASKEVIPALYNKGLYVIDLSGDFNQSLSLGEHGVWDADTDAHGFSFREIATKPQNVTFSWYGDNPKVSNLNIENANLIGVTDDSAVSTTAGVVTHRAAFSAQNDDDTYGIDDSGTSFSGYERDILPFRTYMTLTDLSSPAKAFAKPQSILIYEDTGIEELPQNDEEENDGLRIYAKNRKIYVESPAALSLNLYTATGQLVRVFDVVPGTNTYSGFANGIYIVGKKKLCIK